MKSNNWVALRRGIAEHIADGRLTPNEYLAQVQLILYADAGTGGYNVNAPLLMYRCGYAFNLDTAQRVLRELHRKGYIWYRAQPYSKSPQAYWINRYELTKGLYRSRYTDLSQLYDKSAICQQDVWQHAVQLAPETTGQPTPETTGQLADKNKKDKEKKKDIKKTPILSGEASCAASLNQHSNHAEASCEEGVRSPGSITSDHLEASPSPLRITHTQDSPRALVPFEWGDDVPGLKFLTGEDPRYECLHTGRRIAYDEARRIAQKGNMYEFD